jgi:hypothetical protein
MNKLMAITLGTQRLTGLCDFLTDTGKGLTKSKLTNILNQDHIPLDVSQANILINVVKCRGSKRRAEWQ